MALDWGRRANDARKSGISERVYATTLFQKILTSKPWHLSKNANDMFDAKSLKKYFTVEKLKIRLEMRSQSSQSQKSSNLASYIHVSVRLEKAEFYPCVFIFF